MGNGESPNSRIEWEWQLWVPGAFKLDHLHPVKPILFSKFYNFFTFILGGQFLLPQRANNEKREFSQLQKWTRQRGLSAWGIQTGPFAAWWANFVLKFFQFLHFHTGGQFLLPQRVEDWKWENGILPTWVWEWDFSAWGIQTGPFAACRTDFVF